MTTDKYYSEIYSRLWTSAGTTLPITYTHTHERGPRQRAHATEDTNLRRHVHLPPTRAPTFARYLSHVWHNAQAPTCHHQQTEHSNTCYKQCHHPKYRGCTRCTRVDTCAVYYAIFCKFTPPSPPDNTCRLPYFNLLSGVQHGLQVLPCAQLGDDVDVTFVLQHGVRKKGAARGSTKKDGRVRKSTKACEREPNTRAVALPRVPYTTRQTCTETKSRIGHSGGFCTCV